MTGDISLNNDARSKVGIGDSHIQWHQIGTPYTKMAVQKFFVLNYFFQC